MGIYYYFLIFQTKSTLGVGVWLDIRGTVPLLLTINMLLAHELDLYWHCCETAAMLPILKQIKIRILKK